MSDFTSVAVESFQRQCKALADTRPDACGSCGGRPSFNGVSVRTASMVFDVVGHVPEIVQRRLICSRCKQRTLQRPPELLPRVHYQACVLTGAVLALAQGATTTEVAEEYGCDRRSVGRFVARVAATGDPHEVAREVADVVGEPVIPKIEIAERVSPLAPRTTRDLRCALALLILVEALGSAKGEEPRILRPFMRSRAPCPTMPSETLDGADPPFRDGRRPQPP